VKKRVNYSLLQGEGQGGDGLFPDENPPISPFFKGGLMSPPLEKGGEGGFETGSSDETLDEIEDVRILQPKKGHRFTTDSVLLARLSTPKKYAKVLELGTGCGVVSIILSRRTPSLRITAVEIQEDMARLAERNVKLNNMEHSISVLNMDVKELYKALPSSHFDYIVTNPPYRRPTSGRTSPDKTRSVSNHELSVTINDIMKVSQHLLKVRGRISLIYIADRLVDLFAAMRSCRIEPKEMRCILSNKEGVSRFVRVEGVRDGKPGLNLSCFSKHL